MTVKFETFKKIGEGDQDDLTKSEPSCWNGRLSIRKYRVTVELVDEPLEVIQERIRKLWRENSNHHHRGVLLGAAEEYGMTESELDEPGRKVE